MSKFFKSIFTLTKRYSRFSNTCVYFSNKQVRFGYKLYQKVFKRYKSSQNFRINVRKPRMAVRRKTSFGQALEIREKFSYLLGGFHSSKLRRYCRLSKSKFFAPAQTFINLLETRLDIILYRSNICNSPRIARSFIKNGYIRVNNRKINNPAFRVRTNSFVDFILPNHFYFNLFDKFKLSITKGLLFKPEPINLSISYKLLRVIVDSRIEIRNTFYPFNFNVNYFYRLYSILQQQVRLKVGRWNRTTIKSFADFCTTVVLFRVIRGSNNWIFSKTRKNFSFTSFWLFILILSFSVG